MFSIEIIPKLWIGDIDSLKITPNINCVINCVKDLGFLDKYKNYKYGIRNNLEKYEIIKMYEYLDESCDYIFKNITNNRNILVICENGNQKSVSVACAFLIKYGLMSKKDAMLSIRTKHTTAFYPTPDYEMSLDMMEKKDNK